MNQSKSARPSILNVKQPNKHRHRHTHTHTHTHAHTHTHKLTHKLESTEIRNFI